jgi:N-acetyl-D-muramate 6-phosphate phosphatase
MSLKISAVLFDLDGTLIDSSKDLCYSYNELLRLHNQPEAPPLQLKNDVAHGINQLFERDFSAKVGSSKNKQLRKAFTEIYEANSTRHTCLFSGVDLVLQFLNDARIPWGIVTNKIERFTKPIIQHFQELRETQTLVCGDTLSLRKPDPYPITYACQQLHATPANTAFIGDTEIDLVASRRAGTKGVAVDYNIPIPAEMAQTWGATTLLHQPKELLEWLKKNT